MKARLVLTEDNRILAVLQSLLFVYSNLFLRKLEYYSRSEREMPHAGLGYCVEYQTMFFFSSFCCCYSLTSESSVVNNFQTQGNIFLTYILRLCVIYFGVFWIILFFFAYEQITEEYCKDEQYLYKMRDLLWCNVKSFHTVFNSFMEISLNNFPCYIYNFFKYDIVFIKLVSYAF